MITAADIRNAEFSRAARGYRDEEVNELLDKAAAALEQSNKENSDLLKKLDVLAKKVQEYRDESDSIRNALLTAQRAADGILKKANEEADRKTAGANEYSASTIADADKKAAAIMEETKSRALAIMTSAKNDSDAIFKETEKKARAYASEIKERATAILKEARERSVRIVFEAGEKRKIQNDLFEKTKKTADDYRQSLLDMYKKQIELIEQLPKAGAVEPMNNTKPAEPTEDEKKDKEFEDRTRGFSVEPIAPVNIDNTSKVIADDEKAETEKSEKENKPAVNNNDRAGALDRLVSSIDEKAKQPEKNISSGVTGGFSIGIPVPKNDEPKEEVKAPEKNEEPAVKVKEEPQKSEKPSRGFQKVAVTAGATAKKENKTDDDGTVPVSIKYRDLKFGDDYSLDEDEEDTAAAVQDDEPEEEKHSFFHRKKK